MDSKQLQSWLSETGVYGACSIHVGSHMVLGAAHGLANTTYGIENTLQTRFGTASMAKGFTAVAVMDLVEQGKLDYLTPVSEVLPGRFPSMSQAVNAWHLLTHTSGFSDYFDEEQNINYSDLWNNTPQYRMDHPEAFLPLLSCNTMESAPGTRFKYNNGAFVILAMVIEQVTGIAFTDFVTKNVLQRAGLNDTGYFRMDALPSRTATGYTRSSDGELRSNIYSIPVIGGGDGGIYTTVADLNSFWRALASHTLLSATSVDRAWTPQVPLEGGSLSYGLGFWVGESAQAGRKVLLMGSDPGVSCRSCFYPQHDSVISVLCNSDSGSYKVFSLLESLLLEDRIEY